MDVERDRRPVRFLGPQLGHVLPLGQAALGHFHGDHAGPELYLGVDLGPVDAQRALDLDLAVCPSREGRLPRGRGLQVVVVDQAELVEVQLQAGAAAAGEAHGTRTIDRAGLLVLGRQVLQGDLAPFERGGGLQVGQHQARGIVVEPAAGDLGLAGDLRVAQGAAKLGRELHIAAQLAVAAVEKVPERLHLAVGDDVTLHGPVADDGQMQRRSGRLHRQHQRDGRGQALRARGLGVDGQALAGQGGLHVGIDRHVGRGVDAAGVLERRGHGAAQARALALDAHMGVDPAGEVGIDGLEVDVLQHACEAGPLRPAPTIEVEPPAAERHPDPGRPVRSRKPKRDGLQGVELDLAELAGAGDVGLDDAPGLLIQPRSHDRQRPLRRVGVGVELEGQARERAGSSQPAGADVQRLIAEAGVLGGQVDGALGRGAIGDLQRPGDPARGQHRARADDQAEIRRRRRRAAQRQRARRQHPAGVGLEAGEVQAPRHQLEGRLALRRAVGTVARHGDVAGQALGTLGQGQLHMGAGERQVRGVDLAEVGVELGPRSLQGPGD